MDDRASRRFEAALLALYALANVPRLAVLKEWAVCMFPLNSLSLVRVVTSPGVFESEFARSLVTPTNPLLIFPPGSYALTWLLGSVRGILLFLLVVQAAVPVLLFRLARRHLDPVPAAILAGLSALYLVNPLAWHPDYLIQPILAAVLLAWSGTPPGPLPARRAAAFGAAASVIIVLKHNIGIFTSILLGALIMFRAVSWAREGDTAPGRPFFAFLLSGFLGFGLYFGTRVIYADELYFYILPNLIFWGGTLALLARQPRLGLDVPGFLKPVGVFTAAAIALPLAAFALVAPVFGPDRYVRSLFGMGLKYLPIWDHGILGFWRELTPPPAGGGARALLGLLHNGVYTALLALPAAAAYAVAALVVRDAAAAPRGGEDSAARLEAGAMASLNLFAFFPLESGHILVTKVFVSAYAALRAGLAPRGRASRAVFAGLGALLAGLTLAAAGRAVQAARAPRAWGSAEVRRMVGLPLEPTLAEAVSSQLAVLDAAVGSERFWVLDSHGQALVTLRAFRRDDTPQFYQELRPGAIDDDAAAAIAEGLRRTPYVLVTTADLSRARAGGGPDPRFDALVRQVDAEFAEVARWNPPASVAQVYPFVVFRRKPAG